MAAPVTARRARKAAAAPAKQAAPKEKEAEAPAAPAAPKEPRSRRSAMLPAIVIAVALLGAAFLMKSDGKASTPPAAAAATTGASAATVTDHGDPADVVALTAITLNLSDGRFLKLGLALQLKPGTAVKDAANFGARALDQAIDLFGGYTYAELGARGARAKAKEKLSKEVSTAYDGNVVGVYFTEFVMQ